MDLRKSLRNEILNYEPHPGQGNIKKRFLELVDSEKDLFNRFEMAGHITCGVWILSPDYKKVALVYHPKMEKWLQPGGHLEEGELPLTACRREAAEETNLVDLTPLMSGIFFLDIHSFPEGKDGLGHRHFDVRYAFVANDMEHLSAKSEIKKASWVSLAGIREYTTEPTILAMAEVSQTLWP